MRERGCPAAVPQWVHVHPDMAAPFVEFERARLSRYPKMPAMAAGASGQFSFASNNQTTPTALREDLLGREIKIEHQHGGLQW